MDQLIFDYFPDLTDNQRRQITQLHPLYKYWNEQINVISRKDVDELYERHVLHSLGIAKIIQFKANSKILDIGTGGGFPGIPLAILFPDSSFHLVDSIGKKIKVVKEIAHELGLQNVTADHDRAENIHGKYDFIVSRAVTRMNNFMSWTKNKISDKQKNSLENGILALKGGDLTEEMAEISKKYTSYPLNKVFAGEFFETKQVIHVKL